MKNIRELSFHRKLKSDTITKCVDHLDEIPYDYRREPMDLIIWDKINMLLEARENGELEKGTEFITQELFTEEEWDIFRAFPGRASIGKRFNYILNNNELPIEKISTDWPSKFKII